MSRSLTANESFVHKTLSSKIKLEEITDVRNISMFMDNVAFTVQSPLAYAIKGTDSVLVFGNLTNPINIDQLMKKYTEDSTNTPSDDIVGMYSRIDNHPENKEAKHENEDDIFGADSTRLSEDDIKLIGSQVSVPRHEIIKALVDSDYDVVDTMMKLTKK
ncbi:hypothetical protein OCOL_001559 [Ordospora colligata]|uniref:Putative nascent polypeptide-associated complex protein n=1 Tax=Ordospora colligata OC4 TaxID=1354746 RepID=A0A0B2UM03_9MICR|nr:putative nascent polypeptide-associated complex protein [Ordospora colligata OC4]KHN70264.1 putative nascent polypeptide-associated complex protein [Ordospora colligata OC4]TBU16808.1 putative nascent polypeptide-associated complex protein [Ordospora colligata]